MLKKIWREFVVAYRVLKWVWYEARLAKEYRNEPIPKEFWEECDRTLYDILYANGAEWRYWTKNGTEDVPNHLKS